MLIDRPPQIVYFPSDFEEHLVEVPFVASLRTPSTQLIGRVLAKLLAPLTNRLIGHYNATGYHQFLNITIAQEESILEPDGLADDLGGKAVASVDG